MKPQMDLMKLMEAFDTEAECRAYLEELRWPNGIELTKPAAFATILANCPREVSPPGRKYGRLAGGTQDSPGPPQA